MGVIKAHRFKVFRKNTKFKKFNRGRHHATTGLSTKNKGKQKKMENSHYIKIHKNF